MGTDFKAVCVAAPPQALWNVIVAVVGAKYSETILALVVELVIFISYHVRHTGTEVIVKRRAFRVGHDTES